MALIDEQIVPLTPSDATNQEIVEAIIQLQNLVAQIGEATLPEVEESEEVDLSSIEQRLTALEDADETTEVSQFFKSSNSVQGFKFDILGIHFQVGAAVLTPGSGSHSFPEPFPNGCYHVIFSQNTLPPSLQTNEQGIERSSLSKTGFNYHNLNSGNAQISYLAIGN